MNKPILIITSSWLTKLYPGTDRQWVQHFLDLKIPLRPNKFSKFDNIFNNVNITDRVQLLCNVHISRLIYTLSFFK